VLFIVHTGFEEDGFEEDGEEGTRIISARRATPRERKTYEEAKRAAKTGYRRDSAMKEEGIDLSDMPEVLDWSGAEMGKFYRPPKRSVTMRLDGGRSRMAKGVRQGISDPREFAVEARDGECYSGECYAATPAKIEAGSSVVALYGYGNRRFRPSNRPIERIPLDGFASSGADEAF